MACTDTAKDLQHVEKETSWEDRTEHGFVALIDGETVLAKRDGFQHNGNLRMGGAYDRVAIKELVAEVLKKVPASAA
ncbi:hypothetical protein Ctob_015986 [Chrysochromulina tobinii]|uniref:Uncharacterized protein n=1 Tax=Chrysochromulina tobinii TaxID=1460289 RepID=A0A0M0LP00_9EUKA|nr:hypothetical protein Ctob_015986 [Chrysochromulina tobinii]|eukprot:KOO52764.1 hypothetical protein Ctob_015986 [Chrysochromulina sp. CCMP291]